MRCPLSPGRKPIAACLQIGIFSTLLLVIAFSALAENRPPAPGKDFVWEDSVPLGEGRVVPGHWRERTREGQAWVPGHWESDDIYIPGYWKPLSGTTAGKVWEHGFWSEGSWQEGRWRLIRREGFTWVTGHWTRAGEWIDGHWLPEKPAPSGMTWVPGHWSPRGAWMDGHWRILARPGWTWTPGHYDRRGAWVYGRWLRSVTP